MGVPALHTYTTDAGTPIRMSLPALHTGVDHVAELVLG